MNQIMMNSTLANETLSVLTEFYPSYIPYVPKEVLSFGGLPNPCVSALAALFSLILSATSLMGNLTLILLYFRHKSLRTSGNKLVINLAFSNILMHTKSWIIIINGFAGGPVLGKWGCVSFGGFGTLAGLTEIWTITCIAYERHRAISTPLTKARKLSSFQISCMICFIWTAGIILSVMPLSGISSYVSESYLLVCEFNTWSKDSVDRGYIYFLILTAWFMPVCIIFYCYTKIFLYTSGTRSSVKNLQNTNVTYCHRSSPASRNPFKDVLNSDIFMVERKLAMRLLTIVIIWLLGWTPFAIVALIQLLGYGHHVSKYVSLMCMIVCKSSSVINAYTYGMRLPKFRKRLRHLAPCYQVNEDMEQTVPLTRNHLTRFNIEHPYPLVRHQSLFYPNHSLPLNGRCQNPRSASPSEKSQPSSPNVIINPINGFVTVGKKPIFEKQLIIVKRKIGQHSSICPLNVKSNERRFSL